MENQQTQDKKSSKLILIVVIIIVVLGVAAVIYLTTRSEETTTTTTETNAVATANTTEEADPYVDLIKYDNKIITISSADNKVTGQIAIIIDKTQTMPLAAVYFLKVDDALPKSVAANVGAGEAYYYIANHTTADAINEGDGTGTLSAAFCNTGDMPDVLSLAQKRSIDLELYHGCDAQFDPWHTTETFYHQYISYYNSDTFNYDGIMGNDTLAIFDTAPYYEADEETGGWGADDATVIAQAEPTATYDLIYSD